MKNKDIKEIVADEIAMDRTDRRAARQEFYREQSMHGGDGIWNNYGGDVEDGDSAYIPKIYTCTGEVSHF